MTARASRRNLVCCCYCRSMNVRKLALLGISVTAHPLLLSPSCFQVQRRYKCVSCHVFLQNLRLKKICHKQCNSGTLEHSKSYFLEDTALRLASPSKLTHLHLPRGKVCTDISTTVVVADGFAPTTERKLHDFSVRPPRCRPTKRVLYRDAQKVKRGAAILERTAAPSGRAKCLLTPAMPSGASYANWISMCAPKITFASALWRRRQRYTR
ncbi:unnamed protein product [Phaeothamnion confervicola]